MAHAITTRHDKGVLKAQSRCVAFRSRLAAETPVGHYLVSVSFQLLPLQLREFTEVTKTSVTVFSPPLDVH